MDRPQTFVLNQKLKTNCRYTHTHTHLATRSVRTEHRTTDLPVVEALTTAPQTNLNHTSCWTFQPCSSSRTSDSAEQKNVFNMKNRNHPETNQLCCHDNHTPVAAWAPSVEPEWNWVELFPQLPVMLQQRLGLCLRHQHLLPRGSTGRRRRRRREETQTHLSTHLYREHGTAESASSPEASISLRLKLIPEEGPWIINPTPCNV